MGESIISICSSLNDMTPGNFRALLIVGEGPAFSAGRDLKISKEHTSPAQKARYMRLALDSVLAVESLPMPTIACINGPAFGWGLELALACDLRVAAMDAVLCLPEASLGIFPGAGGTVLLPRIVGPSIAKDLIYTSRRFSGEEALRLGVANRVGANSEEAFQEAMSLASTICSNGPLGCRGAKLVMAESYGLNLSSAMDVSLRHREPLTSSHDFEEALTAFQEKRKPLFEGK